MESVHTTLSLCFCSIFILTLLSPSFSQSATTSLNWCKSDNKIYSYIAIEIQINMFQINIRYKCKLPFHWMDTKSVPPNLVELSSNFLVQVAQQVHIAETFQFTAKQCKLVTFVGDENRMHTCHQLGEWPLWSLRKGNCGRQFRSFRCLVWWQTICSYTFVQTQSSWAHDW